MHIMLRLATILNVSKVNNKRLFYGLNGVRAKECIHHCDNRFLSSYSLNFSYLEWEKTMQFHCIATGLSSMLSIYSSSFTMWIHLSTKQRCTRLLSNATQRFHDFPYLFSWGSLKFDKFVPIDFRILSVFQKPPPHHSCWTSANSGLISKQYYMYEWRILQLSSRITLPHFLSPINITCLNLVCS